LDNNGGEWRARRRRDLEIVSDDGLQDAAWEKYFELLFILTFNKATIS
jgi:hypothetical protein